MSVIKYLICGIIFSVSFYVSFNALYWMGYSETRIEIVKGDK